MALTINGIVWTDGNPLTVGGVQVQSVTANDIEVWKNNSAPTEPIGFTASTDLDGEIEFNWALPIDQGVPICSYEIMDGDEVVTTVGEAETTAKIDILTQGTDFFVRAVNQAGSADSNIYNGNSQEPAGSQRFVANGTFVLKRGWKTYTHYAVGAGGQGGKGGGTGTASDKYFYGLGGSAGQINTATSEITSNIVIGITHNTLSASGGLAFSLVMPTGAGSKEGVVKGKNGYGSKYGTGGVGGDSSHIALSNGGNATGYGAGGGGAGTPISGNGVGLTSSGGAGSPALFEISWE